ncbi:MAG: 4Fe-4S dicluster domain-containing protein [Clostridia bacterium]|nr:4Fe-4S dicluster domain-containing protein [Clostridia bacterium]
MSHQKKNLREEILRISGVNVKKCMKCGKCSASCRAYNEMEYHPHQFVAMIDDGIIEPLLSSDSIYRCLTCFACAERCPRGVEPAKLIEAVRLTATRKQDGDRIKPEDIPCILDENTPGQLLVSAFRKYKK